MMRTMLGHLTTALGISGDTRMQAYERRKEDALIALLGDLCPQDAIDACDELSE